MQQWTKPGYEVVRTRLATGVFYPQVFSHPLIVKSTLLLLVVPVLPNVRVASIPQNAPVIACVYVLLNHSTK